MMKSVVKKNAPPATKEDLSDMRDQLLDAIGGKLIAQERNIIDAVDMKFVSFEKKMDEKLAIQKEEIVKDVADFIVDTIVPLIDKQDQRIAHIENQIARVQ